MDKTMLYSVYLSTPKNQFYPKSPTNTPKQRHNWTSVRPRLGRAARGQAHVCG